MPLLKSIDGGKTFKRVKGPHHGDHHDLWIDPKNPERMIDGNDGGVDITTNGGETWYRAAAADRPVLPRRRRQPRPLPRRAARMQDLGTAPGPEQQPAAAAASALGDWHNVGGGEAGYVVADPTDPNIVYAGEYGGYHLALRPPHRARPATSASTRTTRPATAAEDLQYRFQWTAPIADLAARPEDGLPRAPTSCSAPRDGGQTWDGDQPAT